MNRREAVNQARHWGPIFLTWIVHVGLWLLFVANLNPWEGLVGLGRRPSRRRRGRWF